MISWAPRNNGVMMSGFWVSLGNKLTMEVTSYLAGWGRGQFQKDT